MPYSETRVVLNREAIGERGETVRMALRKLFPNLVITERDGEGSQALILEVQSLKVDAVSHESYFESKGAEISLEFEHALTWELSP